MAFGATSKIFDQFLITRYTSRTANAGGDFVLTSDTLRIALYNDTPTPSGSVAATATCYNAGEWATASREVFQAVQWDQGPTGGKSLASVSVASPSANFVRMTATNPSSGTAFTTPSATYGCLIYDSTITGTTANQGVCYLSFNGSNSVSNGQLAVQFNASGIWQFAL